MGVEMSWLDDDRYSDGIWCPDCGLPREVCVCEHAGVGDWYEDAPDDDFDDERWQAGNDDIADDESD